MGVEVTLCVLSMNAFWGARGGAETGDEPLSSREAGGSNEMTAQEPPVPSEELHVRGKVGQEKEVQTMAQGGDGPVNLGLIMKRKKQLPWRLLELLSGGSVVCLYST